MESDTVFRRHWRRWTACDWYKPAADNTRTTQPGLPAVLQILKTTFKTLRPKDYCMESKQVHHEGFLNM